MTDRSDPARPVRQHTVARSAEWRGERRRRRTDVLVVHPAEPDSGIRFLRLGDAASAAIPARWDAAIDSRSGVVLGDARGALLHGAIPLLAALRIGGVDNAVVEVQGSRLPAQADDFTFYLDTLAEVGLQDQPSPRRLLRVVDTVAVRDRFGFATLSPARGFRACIHATAIGPGGHVDTAWGAFVGDFTEPHGRIRTLVTGPHLASPSARSRAGESMPGGDLRALPDGLRGAAIELIGHLALAGAPLAGCIRTHDAGPGLYQMLLRAAMERGAIQAATVDRDSAAGSIAPPTGTASDYPVCTCGIDTP
jgi:UDP-3-O-[3-hydroxymyristoyl] N-acetylglucosamine deacetylase